MRFLADENYPLASVNRLREAGHDVSAVIKDSPGARDSDILARAVREQRIIITFDRNFGELIFRLKLPAPAGVVYFRFDPLTPEEPANYLKFLLGIEFLPVVGRFTFLEREQIRQRPLPAGK